MPEPSASSRPNCAPDSPLTALLTAWACEDDDRSRQIVRLASGNEALNAAMAAYLVWDDQLASAVDVLMRVVVARTARLPGSGERVVGPDVGPYVGRAVARLGAIGGSGVQWLLAAFAACQADVALARKHLAAVDIDDAPRWLRSATRSLCLWIEFIEANEPCRTQHREHLRLVGGIICPFAFDGAPSACRSIRVPCGHTVAVTDLCSHPDYLTCPYFTRSRRKVESPLIKAAIEHAGSVFAAGDLTSTLTAVDAIVTTDPGCARAHHLAALALRGQHQTHIAYRRATLASDLDPGNAEYAASLNALALDLDELELALYHGERAVKLAPDNTLCLANLAAAFVAAGQLAEAVALYDRIIKLAPEDAEALHDRQLLLARMNKSN